MEPSLPLIDLPRIAQLRQLNNTTDEDIVKELFEIFLDSTSGVIKALERALVESDVKACFKLAHKLKGSCANLGASRLEHIAAEIEEMSRTQQLKDGQQLFEVIRSTFNETCACLASSIESFQQSRAPST